MKASAKRLGLDELTKERGESHYVKKLEEKIDNLAETTKQQQ